ncbi:cytosolic carboxypeptidase 2-like isoform X2 [Lineus longissimus]|uniref:cytosolic carboxypeptidase 2-like isoform X2 n=1 Tax=Lineus longissimus TaxID=88925 RepID=UPI00315C8B6B
MSNGKQEWYDVNPYDSFMKRHLQHYGYYTGKNEGYRHSLASFDEWDKTHGYDLSSDSDDSEYENKALREKDDKDFSNRVQLVDLANNSVDGDGKSPDDLRTTQLTFSNQSGRMVPRLKEPRQLYPLAKEVGPQQAARWPVEIQVLKDRVKYINYVPPEPELLYTRTGTEPAPLVRGEEGGGRVVYQYEPSSGPFFIRSRVGGHRAGCLDAAVKLESERDTTLIFESRYESGNLAKAVQVGEFEYELWLRTDMYTNKHTQWYNFRVSNTRANQKYRFSIVNHLKSDSLYNNGMRPLMYSEKNAAEKKIGWKRFGSMIRYHRNNLKYSTNKAEKSYYSLTFTCEFPYDNDTVYVAHCYPYTYTDLQDYILNIMNDPVKSKICKQKVLCRTLAGNMVYVLTITSPSKGPEEVKHKKAVVITARVHPGETNASWMMKGFLDYLCGNSADAKLLRDTFIFKIVPMLNPDGVIVGNYRCSLAGRDLNRNYKTVLKESFPSVWHCKNMIKRLAEEREIIVYCDLHGHSRKHNVFIYGCENRNNPSRRLRERIFPVMLGRNASDKFSFEGCKFKMQKSKEGTGRIVMWNLGIMNSYTLEATFAGSTLGKKKGYHFSTADFESMGFHFCDTLLDYCDPDGTKCARIICELEERVKLEIIARLEKQGQEVGLDDVNLSDAFSDAGSRVCSSYSDSGGSDSSVSDGLPVHLQFMTKEFESKKKKKLKTKKQLDSQRKDAKTQNEAERLHRGSPGSSHQHCKQSVPPKPTGTPALRYASQGVGSAKRPRSKAEEANSRAGSGVPQFVKERMEERESKKTEYIEALTNAMKNGLFAPLEGPSETTRTQPAKINTGTAHEVPHFRYSLTTKASPTFPINLANLCPHHEQTFAAQYMTNQLNEPDDTDAYTFARNGQDEDDKTIPRYRFINRKNSAKNPSDQRLNLEVRPSQRHLLELAVAHQRQQDFLQMESRRQGTADSRKSPIRQHPPPFDENLEREKSHDYVKRGHSAKGSASRPRVPSATPMYMVGPTSTSPPKNPEDFAPNFNNNSKSANGKKAPKAKSRSHGDLKHAEQVFEFDDVYGPIRGKTHDDGGSMTIRDGSQPEKSSKDISHTIDSIQKLKQSVIDSAQRANLSPTTGQYIVDNVREIDEEVNCIAAELEGSSEANSAQENSDDVHRNGRTNDKKTDSGQVVEDGQSDQVSTNSSASRYSDRQTHKSHASEQYDESRGSLSQNSGVWNAAGSLPPPGPVRRTLDNYSNGNSLTHQIEPMERIVVTSKGQVRFENVMNEQRRNLDLNLNKASGKLKHVNGATRVLKTRATDSLIIDDSQSVRSKSSCFFNDADLGNAGDEERTRLWNNARAEQGQGSWDEVETPRWPGEQRRDSTGSFSDRDGKPVSEQRQGESPLRQVRARSSKGPRTPQELTSPTKISLMMTQGHHDPYQRSKFLPLTRSRPPLLRIPKKK